MRLRGRRAVIAILTTGIVAAVVSGVMLSTGLPDALARDDVAAQRAGLEQQLEDRRVQAAALDEQLQAASEQLSEARALSTKTQSTLRKSEKKAHRLHKEVTHLRRELATI